MSDPNKVVSRNHRLKPQVLEFIDAFSATYGLSKSAVVNFALLHLKDWIESTAAHDPRKGAELAMAVSMQAQTFNP
ncbi:hypothetical protein [uncultured Pseudodesulfovibrio sp.]|uniref:hypothetical protein n=1 Tax=uncultured Pseudodesulfovibrio sp. TaxID=2035858 RepID=UPI0029C961FA|nr:hypothetical protein [uncultured Pseudodesulfovibrio sp.]